MCEKFANRPICLAILGRRVHLNLETVPDRADDSDLTSIWNGPDKQASDRLAWSGIGVHLDWVVHRSTIAQSDGDRKTDTDTRRETVTRPANITSALLAASLGASTGALAGPNQLGPEHVLLIYNSNVADSVAVRDLYLEAYPTVLTFDIAGSSCIFTGGLITRQQYLDCIRNPIRDFLNGAGGGPDLSEQIVVLLTTRGVPTRIEGANEFSGQLNSTFASVESELTLLQQDLEAAGASPLLQRHFGIVDNPYHTLIQPILNYSRTNIRTPRTFNQVSVPGGPLSWVATGLTPGDLYLVCRLDSAPGPNTSAVEEIGKLIERSQHLTATRCEGQFLLDAFEFGSGMLDESGLPPSFPSLPDYVRTNGFLSQAGWTGQFDRTFAFITGNELTDPTKQILVFGTYGENHKINGCGEDPPGSGTYLNLGYDFHPASMFLSIESFNGNSIISGLPRGGQGQVLDFIPKGGSFTIGHVAEPFSFSVPDVEFLSRSMLIAGLSFAEAAWIAMPGLSWQQVPVGNPLARIEVLSVSSPDQNRDGRVNVEDLYFAERKLLDLNCDGIIDDADRRLVLDAVRAGELSDILP